MPQVTVIVNGRTYRLMCGQGEEARVTELADHIRQRIDDLSYVTGSPGDERLLLMAAIMLADELWEARTRAADLERRLAEIEGGPVAATREPEQVEFEPEPRQADHPAVAETDPAAAPPAAEAFIQEPSLKRALRRPQQGGAGKSSMEDRLAAAQGQRKTGSA